MLITFITLALLTTPVQSAPRQPMLAPKTEFYSLTDTKKKRK